MKNSTKTIALLSSAAFFALSNAVAVTTSVVGYTSTTLPAGNSLFAPAFVNPTSAAGVLSGVSAGETSSLTVSGLSSGAFDEGANFPLYYVEILNDTNLSDSIDTEGLILDIISNTESSVTVGADVSGLGLVGDEQYVIRKHLTLTDLTDGATGLSNFDGATIYNASAPGSVDSYLYNGGVWQEFDGAFVDRPNVVIYPGTGFVFSLQGSVTLVVDGEVKETATQVPLYANQPNFVGVMKPLANFDMDSDGAVQDALVNFEGLTTYQDGNLAPTSVLVYNDDIVDGSLQPTSLVVDGTKDSLVISVQTSKVYKVSGTVIP